MTVKPYRVRVRRVDWVYLETTVYADSQEQAEQVAQQGEEGYKAWVVTDTESPDGLEVHRVWGEKE